MGVTKWPTQACTIPSKTIGYLVGVVVKLACYSLNTRLRLRVFIKNHLKYIYQINHNKEWHILGKILYQAP